MCAISCVITKFQSLASVRFQSVGMKRCLCDIVSTLDSLYFLSHFYTLCVPYYVGFENDNIYTTMINVNEPQKLTIKMNMMIRLVL